MVKSRDDLINADVIKHNVCLRQRRKFVFYGMNWEEFFNFVDKDPKGNDRRGSFVVWKGDQVR